jgi:hypothetical protein
MQKKSLHCALFVCSIVLSSAGAARAWDVAGHVFCADTGLPLANVTVNVTGTSASGAFTGTATTDFTGIYFIFLPDTAGTYTETLDFSAVGGVTQVSPDSTETFSTDSVNFQIVEDFVVSSPGCTKLGCWLTGGGTVIDKITGLPLAVHDQSKSSFGGNVNPGCSPTAGSGGDWNHVDRPDQLHFHGTSIVVDRCGNVDGIPPGSRSPKTPFNFIEFHGTGKLVGFQGNKADYGLVCFQGRAEDRHEPGSGNNAGANADRYYLRVTDCTSGTTLLLLDDPTQPPASNTPITINSGNLQIHVSSCP